MTRRKRPLPLRAPMGQSPRPALPQDSADPPEAVLELPASVSNPSCVPYSRQPASSDEPGWSVRNFLKCYLFAWSHSRPAGHERGAALFCFARSGSIRWTCGGLSSCSVPSSFEGPSFRLCAEHGVQRLQEGSKPQCPARGRQPRRRP
jgi:hypothetical protein